MEKTPHLRTVNVTRYITPLREGGSLPALAEADDDFKYVLKFKGAGHGVKALIAELIGGEIARVLKPGGKLLVLEFSKVAKPLTKIYDWYSFKVLPRLGKLIAKDASSYQYLAESIRLHPGQDELKAMMHKGGFGHVDYHNLSGGVVALHVGIRC